MQRKTIPHHFTFFLIALIPYATSITFNFTNIGPNNHNRDIKIQGNGTNISDEGIQLTQSIWSSGRATYIKPLHLWNSRSGEIANFSTNFTFVIDSNQNNSYGDGLTFFLAQNNSVMKKGGAIGLPLIQTPSLTSAQFVAVEFDTYWNPSWDPMGDHVGIDISSVESVASQKWLSNIPGGRECQAWITYDSVSKNLTVSFTGFQSGEAFRQDGLFYTIDLRKLLPERVIFGFSAATGDHFQKNTVRSWTFDSSDLSGDETNERPPIPIPDPVNGKSQKKVLKVFVILGIVLVTVTILGALVFALLKKMNKTRDEQAENGRHDVDMNYEIQMGTGPKQFSYHELARSTQNFAKIEKLGEGGFGEVYRGVLKDSNTFVAVKRVSKSSKQGINEYASEVRIISRLRHKNLVQLIGWCHEKGELLLVYEYMENGSLDSHLFKEKTLLTWDTRYKIVNGLANALLYLHEEWEQCVLHRDIKSSNVMLDSKFNVKLGDFGLAKLVDHEKGSKTTEMAGTIGYMAPECVVTGKSTTKSDVFSFGVVALEIACGRKPLEYKAQENQMWLLEWVWELYGTRTLLEAVDSRLGSDFNDDEVEHLMMVGLWCVHPDSEVRPSMRQVTQVLKHEALLPRLPSKMPISSYWKPSIVPNKSVNAVSNRDSSNHSVFIGR